MNKKFYVTTPIYYVNDVPHIGHAYTTIAADVMARYRRINGYEVMFLTGTDEHGQKVSDSAAAKGLTPQALCDQNMLRFKEAWSALNISNNDFIRTTEDRHVKVVQDVFSKLIRSGDIYKGEYVGLYCTPCETFWTETQLKDGKCPDCGRDVQKLKEETFYFKLSKYEKQLLTYIEEHPEFIMPMSRRNEVLSFIKGGLKDLSVTRTAFNWGVPIKEDPKHVVYVWFDALINYISAVGYGVDQVKFDKWWPADIHLMGKEIVRFHAVIWPSMLMALDVKLPKVVFGHGWWTVEGEKMSKSKGNVIDPIALSKEFGVDPVRYFLMREVPFGSDGDYSRNSLIHRFNSDLANDIGNLLNRTLTMIEKYFNGNVEVPLKQDFDELSREFIALQASTVKDYSDRMEKLEYSDALAIVWKLINFANNYIEKEAPWKLSKEGKIEEIRSVMFNLYRALCISTVLVYPFMPTIMDNMWKQLGFTTEVSEPSSLACLPANGGKIAAKISKGSPLFPRIDTKTK